MRTHAHPTPSAARRRHPSVAHDLVEPDTAVLLHRVVALVGRVDRRALAAVDAARALGADHLEALHVVEPGEDLDELASRWMRLPCSSLPLATVDAEGSVAETVAKVVAGTTTDERVRVTVVLGRVLFARRWHRLLHDHTGERIAAAVASVPRVEVLWVPVLVPA